MKERSKKIIALAISVIIGVASVVLFMHTPAPQAAIHSPVTEEYYNMLKENALKFAKTLDKRVIENKEIVPGFYYNNDELIVIVESSTAKVTAKYPVLNSSIKIEEGIMISNGKVNYKDVTYIEETKLKPIMEYLLIFSAFGLMIGFAIYALLNSSID